MAKDILSSLPLCIIDTILCHLPIRDAVRTSIVSRDWRYHWTRIPKVVFNEYDMFDKAYDEYKFLIAIYQVLLQHQGPIVEFSLSMDAYVTRAEVAQIILHLSRRKTIKKLALDFVCDRNSYWLCECYYKLPLSVLSFHELTDLSLSSCELDFIPTFSGFGSLTSLSLDYVDIPGETILRLISGCPLLKRLRLKLNPLHVGYDGIGFSELFKCLPVIEHLTVDSWAFGCCATGELPTELLHLKSLCISEMMFCSKSRLRALFLFIRSSPNLEKIKLEHEILDDPTEIWDPEIDSLDDFSDVWADISDVWLENLYEVEINDFTNFEVDLEFLKLILVKSPVLKKVRLVLAPWVKTEEELNILSLPCSSPVAEILIKHKQE